MAKTGRPSSYTKKLAEKICERIALGESMRAICGGADMPSRRTVMRWLGDHEDFRALHAIAREMQADHFFEEIIEIADDAGDDFMEREHKDGSTEKAFDGEHVQRSRLRVDARKWVAAKLAPKKYGDKIQHTGDGGGPVSFIMNLHGEE